MIQTLSKKKGIFVTGLAVITILTGCGGHTAPLDDAAIIDQALVQLSNARSIEYNITSEDSVSYGEEVNRNETYLAVRQIRNPFTGHSKSESKVYKGDGTTSRTVIETFQTLNEATLDFYLRNSMEECDITKAPTLSQWQKNSLDDEKFIQTVLNMRRKTDEAQIALLRENLSTFKRIEDGDTSVYQGVISPDSVLNVYRDYVRSLYIEVGMVKDSKNPSSEDLRRELMNEDRPEFQTGFTKIAYSEEPIPVTLYIDREKSQMKRIILDEKVALQAILSKNIPKHYPESREPQVTKSICVITIEGINTVQELIKPI